MFFFELTQLSNVNSYKHGHIDYMHPHNYGSAIMLILYFLYEFSKKKISEKDIISKYVRIFLMNMHVLFECVELHRKNDLRFSNTIVSFYSYCNDITKLRPPIFVT